MPYAEKLNATKSTYPFDRWRQSAIEFGMEQYTEENCNRFKAIFDKVVDGLVALGPEAGDSKKIALFEEAILATNTLNGEDVSLIETGEREDLCELTNTISLAAGLHPEKYGDGEGLASLWREW